MVQTGLFSTQIKLSLLWTWQQTIKSLTEAVNFWVAEKIWATQSRVSYMQLVYVGLTSSLNCSSQMPLHLQRSSLCGTFSLISVCALQNHFYIVWFRYSHYELVFVSCIYSVSDNYSATDRRHGKGKWTGRKNVVLYCDIWGSRSGVTMKEILWHDAVWIRKYLRRFRKNLLPQSWRWSKINI